MLEKINNIIWGNGMLFLLLSSGLYFSVRTGFFQLRGTKTIFRSTIYSLFTDKSTHTSSDKNSISPFQALSTALSATMGTGNIVGVATAITLGGAGAIFWMWISAILGMMIVYAENVLGSRYRYKNNKGEWVGGAMAYLEHGLKSRHLAILFAVFCILASFGMGNMTQTHSISSSLKITLNIPPIISGIAVAIVIGIIIMGGIKRIGNVTQAIIPPLSLIYILATLAVILLNYENIPDSLSQIFKGAFGLSAVVGGVSGALIKQAINVGLRRGVFSNEAGLGSSGLLHSASDNKSPHQQGMWGIFEVFVDTILCCTLTALAILCTGSDKLGIEGSEIIINAFSSCLGKYSGIFMTFAILLFAFATLIGWSYCGECATRYIFGENGVSFYKLIFLTVIIIGATSGISFVWTLSDIFNGLMAIPNLIGVLLLSGEVIQVNKTALKRSK